MDTTNATLAAVGREIRELTRELEGSDATGNSAWARLDNEMARFDLWARNLGLYTGGHSSLDYRFRDAQLLFDHTLSLLRDLSRVLSQLLKVATRDVSPDEGDVSEDSEEEDVSSYQERPLFGVLTDSTAATIDKLYRLAFKIRNPAMRLGSSRALGYREVDQQTGVDLIQQFAVQDERYIQDLFRSYSPLQEGDHYLIARLAKANTRRRQQFRYWKKRREAVERLSMADLVGECADKGEMQIPEEPQNLFVPGLEPIVVAPSQPSTATWLDTGKVKLDEDMSVISTVSFLPTDDDENGDSILLPAPPNPGPDAKEFECPYCFTICPRKMLNKKHWETHILRDLRPYICTYSRCKAPDQPYDSIGDWINHEVLNHGVQASNKEGLQVTPSESQTQRACPFCLMSAVSPFHIASHLRRIASFALPRYTGDDNTGDESGLSDEAELRSRQSKLPGATFSNDSGKGPGNDQLASEPKYIASSSLKDIEQLIPRNETNLMNVHNFLGTLDKGSQPLSGKDESSTVDNNHKSFYDSDMELDYDAYAGGDYGYNSMPSSSGSQADGTPHSQNIAPPAHQQDQELPYARLEPDGRLADRPSSPVEFERKDTETNEPLQEDTLSQSNNNADTDQRDVPAPHETYNPTEDALALRDALSRSRNIDTKTLIQILPHLTNHEMLDLRKEYKKHVKISGKGVNLAKHIRVKLGNSAIGKVCYATALGRWESEAFWANCYYQLGSSRRELLIESLFGRSNGEMREIKNSFKDSQYADSLEKCMMAELKADKFRTAVLLALEEGRQSECDTVDTELVHRDVQALHAALISRNGGETGMMYIIVRRSDSHLREVLRAYEKNYNRNFAREMIQKSQNLVGETLAHILNGAINRPMRDALLLHQALHESRSGGGRSELLISRLVRLHWEPRHCENVKAEFRRRYGQRLEEAIVEEILPSSGGSEWGEFCIQLALSSRSHAAKG